MGRAVGFDAPGVGPGRAGLRLADEDQVVACSRVCTHAGCFLVGYDANNQVLFCPCHGAEYDPAQHAEVLAPPTSTPLPGSIPIEVKSASGARHPPDLTTRRSPRLALAGIDDPTGSICTCNRR